METTVDKNCRWLEFATRSSVITIRGPGLWFDGDERPGQGQDQDQDQARASRGGKEGTRGKEGKEGER